MPSAAPNPFASFDPSSVTDEVRQALSGKTMILGVGAQKAGTSWIFDYLADDPNVFAPPVKEFHFFNAWLRPQLCGGYDDRFDDLLRRVERSPNRLLQPRRLAALRARVAMTEDRIGYLSYFAANIGDRPAMTEISPCYSLLHGNDFRKVKRYFAAAGVTVKPVFIMRDPVERHYSERRMRERDTEGLHDAKGRFETSLRLKGLYLRGRYDRTIRALWRAFGEDGVAIAFYETLFSDPDTHLKRIADFAGIDYRRPDIGRAVNASPRNAELDVTQVAAGVERFKDVYEFVNSFFSKEKPESWRA